MDRKAITEGLDALCVAARARMPHGGAEVEFMTSEERQEMHRLKSLLPPFGQEAKEARERLAAKHAQRKNKFTLLPLPIINP